jgi:hypothetical protein
VPAPRRRDRTAGRRRGRGRGRVYCGQRRDTTAARHAPGRARDRLTIVRGPGHNTPHAPLISHLTLEILSKRSRDGGRGGRDPDAHLSDLASLHTAHRIAHTPSSRSVQYGRRAYYARWSAMLTGEPQPRVYQCHMFTMSQSRTRSVVAIARPSPDRGARVESM